VRAGAEPPPAVSLNRGGGALLIGLLLLTSVCAPLSAIAQPDLASSTLAEGDERDQRVRTRVQHILERGEFHEFDSVDSERLWLSKLIERLFGRRSEPEPVLPSSPRFDVHVPPWLLIAIAAGLLAVVAGYVGFEVHKLIPRGKVLGPVRRPPLMAADPSATIWLSDAAALARAGRYREALRALYTATLLALDRRRQIRFEAGRTNGDYVRSLVAGPLHDLLAHFTEAVERKWYGQELSTELDYEHARQLAEKLCEPEPTEPQA
jgi:hypothetical protein